MTGRLRSAIEVIPVGERKGGSMVFRDLISATTSKGVSSAEAGSFDVRVALPRGRGAQLDPADNDMVKLFLWRGDSKLPDSPVFIGQIDRVTRSARTDAIEWGLRGKCLTKQFLTNVVFLNSLNAESEGMPAVRADMVNLAILAQDYLNCGTGTLADENGKPVATGVKVGCVVENLVSLPIWIDPDLLFGVDVHAGGLVTYGSQLPVFQSVGEVLSSLADPPYLFWYVDELGVFHFKPFNWRDGTPQANVEESDYISDHTSTCDYRVIAACSVMPDTRVVNEVTGLAFYAHEGLAKRYGIRYQRMNNVPYLYTLQMAQKRAQDQVEMQYATRMEAQVTCFGTGKFHTDTYVFVPRLDAYFYVESIQHAYNSEGGAASWLTTLGLTYGRRKPDSFIDSDAAQLTILNDLKATGTAATTTSGLSLRGGR